MNFKKSGIALAAMIAAIGGPASAQNPLSAQEVNSVIREFVREGAPPAPARQVPDTLVAQKPPSAAEVVRIIRDVEREPVRQTPREQVPDMKGFSLRPGQRPIVEKMPGEEHRLPANLREDRSAPTNTQILDQMRRDEIPNSTSARRSGNTRKVNAGFGFSLTEDGSQAGIIAGGKPARIAGLRPQ